MTEKNQRPDEEPTEQETVVPLPERDAMSIIGTPGSVIGIDGEVPGGSEPAEGEKPIDVYKI